MAGHPQSERGTEQTLDCDVCVVGATLAGLWLALALALRGREVVVLDAGGPAPHAGSGLVRPGLGLGAAQLCARTDRATARRIYDLSADAAAGAVRLLDALRLNVRGTGAFTLPGPLGKSDLLEEAAARDVLGIGELPHIGRLDVAEVLGIPGWGGALYDAEPVTYAARRLPQELATAVRAAGARIFFETPVRESDLDGVRKYLRTGTHRVRADHVVFAGERNLGAFAPWLARGLMFQAFATGSFSHDAGGPMASEAVIEGGARGVRFAWEGTTLGFAAPTARLIRGEIAVACALRRHVRRFYPSLASAVVGDARGAALPVARHGLPLIGAYRPGVWYALALGIEPIANASLASELIAAAIVERDDRFRVFAPFGPQYTWGMAGRYARRLGYWAGRLADAANRRDAQREAKLEEA
ncbi:NAD(P)/FAD-dependent oxidoreductase [Aquabacter spiritensis]|uniref:Glycine/D-amino acid oxidase-like deaminating enzyme n=1 Tax=Aquabacter spiritensis TaxID=933073 RepID=A0A4V6NZH0_9HYPH|nr:FAD-binding oxidoreductase [Aquabacter spiritensis]TCT02678.1 glycine/D-amino acid oxidase-like deaminating enzyme [Aquabacter spiritensis]